MLLQMSCSNAEQLIFFFEVYLSSSHQQLNHKKIPCFEPRFKTGDFYVD